MLANSVCQEPQLDAELLLGHVLAMSRAQIYSQPERALSPEEITHYGRLVLRRARGEPLAYILGHKTFYDLDFLVDPRVLIPRPETELLVERALEVSAAQITAGRRPVIADVGTGCGAIAVCLAVHQPEVSIYAVDVSAAALEVAALNCRRHGVGARVILLRGDLLLPLPEPVSLLVANLPYVAQYELEELPPSIRHYEPLLALDGGRDGLEQIERLLSQSSTKLTPDGTILLEIGARQGSAARALAQQYFPDAEIRILPDYAGLDRLMIMHIT